MSSIEQLSKAIDDSHKIVFFGGAGVSTESGIPDFRSAEGIFMEKTGNQYSPEQIISHTFFANHPEAFFDFYFNKLIYPEAKANSGHLFLSELEERGKEITIVTQNIDGLHHDAGSTNILELHGTVKENYCITCGKDYSLDHLKRDSAGIPRCELDGGIVRPNVVLYEEGLDTAILEASIQAISRADMLIIAGTSLVVYPAAGLVNYFQGDNLVVINKTLLPTSRKALVFEDSLGNIFGQLSNN